MNSGPALAQLWGQPTTQFGLSSLSKANTQVLNGSKTNKAGLKLTMCFSVFLIESGPQSEGQQSSFCHLPACIGVLGSEEQAPLLIATALFTLGKHWQNSAQEFHLAFLQHLTNTTSELNITK